MRSIFIGLCAALILAAGIYFLAPRTPQGEKAAKDVRSAVGSEDVKREVGEAVETTKVYLLQKKEELLAQFDKRMKDSEEKIAELRKGASGAGEAGRDAMEKHLEVLRQKEEEVRRRYGELKESGEAFREEAEEKLETALRELEEAYGKAKEKLGSGSKG